MGFAEFVAAADRVGQRLLGGESVTYAPAVGTPVQVTGVFDAPYNLVKGGESPMFNGVEAVTASIFLRLSDLPVNPEQDTPTITIAAATDRPAALVGNYTVTERRPDNMGGIVLQLRKA